MNFTTGSRVGLQTRDVGLRNFLIHLQSEEQRDIDVDSFADALLDSRNTFHGGWNLHHEIGTVYRFPQAARVLNGALRVLGQEGRDFQTHVAIALVGAVVDGPQRVGGVLDVLDSQDLVNRHGIQILALLQFKQGVGVIGAPGDGLLKDGGIGSHSPQAVFVDEVLQLAAGNQIAANVIEPDRLAILTQLPNRISGLRRGDGWDTHDLLVSRFLVFSFLVSGNQRTIRRIWPRWL